MEGAMVFDFGSWGSLSPFFLHPTCATANPITMIPNPKSIRLMSLPRRCLSCMGLAVVVFA
jgi:hypothetical protein